MTTGLQLVSTVNSDNTLRLSLQEIDVPTPAAEEILVRIEATPLNPTDMASLFGPADRSTLRADSGSAQPALVADIPAQLMGRVATRLDKPLPTGSEGAGVVIDAGDAPQAQALLGKVVSIATGSQHGQYCCVKYSNCIPMPEGVTPEQAASAFVNPLTALGFVETMRMEGHKALVNTAAASNLGIMLNRICLADQIDLVNIVRKPEQERQLRELGARYVLNSSAENFHTDLVDTLAATGATIAFDAIGGGSLGSDILSAMEQVAAKDMAFYNHYGSQVFKQLYIYGLLDLSPTAIKPGMGFAWAAGGWLLFNFFAKAGKEVVTRLRERVAAEITTTFASHYTRTISLQEALDLDVAKAYSRLATGEKYLIAPHR